MNTFLLFVLAPLACAPAALLSFLTIPCPVSTLFPYTTLFLSCAAASNNDLHFQFKVGVDIPHFTGMASHTADVQPLSSVDSLPPFWNYEPCNATGTAFSSNISVSLARCQNGAFSDTWGGQHPR